MRSTARSDSTPTDSAPNRLGLTTCEVVGVTGLELVACGLDAIDGSPVLDIKAHIREFQPRAPVVQPEWISELVGRSLVTDRSPQERIAPVTW